MSKQPPSSDLVAKARPTGAGHRILLAEDDEEMRALMGMQLRRDGYDLTELANGFALFAAITNVRANLMPMPSVIVSDVRMPGLSGLSILRVVREYGWRVPVVLITAFGSEETLNEAAKLEASIVLHKPFEIDDLRAAVRCVLPVLPPPN